LALLGEHERVKGVVMSPDKTDKTQKVPHKWQIQTAGFFKMESSHGSGRRKYGEFIWGTNQKRV